MDDPPREERNKVQKQVVRTMNELRISHQTRSTSRAPVEGSSSRSEQKAPLQDESQSPTHPSELELLALPEGTSAHIPFQYNDQESGRHAQLTDRASQKDWKRKVTRLGNLSADSICVKSGRSSKLLSADETELQDFFRNSQIGRAHV